MKTALNRKRSDRVALGLVGAASLLLLLAAAVGSQPAEERRCLVTLELQDAETNERLAGMIQVTDANGGRIAPTELLPRGLGVTGEHPIHGWSVLPGSGVVTVSLPRQAVTLTAIAGLESEAVRQKIDLSGKAEQAVRLPIRRFYRAASRGLRSANTHLHLMKISREESDRYLREVPAADGLDLLFVSYLERAGADHDYITNRYTSTDLARLGERSSVAYGNGEEHRHNFAAQGEGYGHVMLLNLKQLVLPVSIGPGIMKVGTDGLPMQRGIDSARRDGATAIWCHNRWGLELIPNWVLGRLDAQNIFDGGAHGSFKDSFYRFLNAGYRVPFSTGTDWFIYDFARVYVPMTGPVTPQEWLKELAAGRSYITNGPFLEFTVDGKPFGETLKLDARGTVEVRAKGLGRTDFRQLELVRDGKVVETAQTRSVQRHFEAEAKWTVDLAASGWLALRTPPPVVAGESSTGEANARNEFGQPLFSHTSPVYVEVAGKPIFDPATARELLADVERAARQVAEAARFADDVERGRVLDVYHEAIAALKRRLASASSGG